MKRTLTWGGLALAMAWSTGCGDVNITGPTADWPKWPRRDDPTDVRVTSDWRGPLAPGQQLEIKGVIGNHSAVRAPGGEVVVTATKVGQPDEVAAVRIDVVPHALGVTVCAVYPDAPGRAPNSCQPGAAGNLSAWDRGQGLAAVDFAIQVPDGVVLISKNLTGNLTATNLRSDAFLATMAGDIRVSTSRLATAATLSGSIAATIGLPDWDRDLQFTTMNGDVRVTIPAATNAVVQAAAPAGHIRSDFPLSAVAPGDLRGTLGSGGPTLKLTTLAGDITLSRGP